MIVHPFPQGSPAWYAARCGKITASATERYFAPDKKALRKNRAGDGLAVGAVTYLYELLAEWYFGVPAESGSSQFMRRGNAMEAQARAAYEFATMIDVRECGFIESDSGPYGSSVDGLAGDDGLVEIKVLSAREHLRVFHEGGDRAVAQAQAQMADTGRKWVDRFFWNPRPELYIAPMRTERDDDFIEKLSAARTEIARKLDALQQRHLVNGFEPPKFDPSKWDKNGERAFDAEESAQRIAWIEAKRAEHNQGGR
jgi:exodeoxyribonuclease (lambda-induced)